MFSQLEKYISENNTVEIEKFCKNNNYTYLLSFLNFKLNMGLKPVEKKTIRIQLLCHWCDSPEIKKLWDKMSEGSGKWGNIETVCDNPDYYVVINKPFGEPKIDKKKTIVFQMEPYMPNKKHIWGEWAEPDKREFLKVFSHDTDYNNNEWHLSKTYFQLVRDPIIKNPKISNKISVIVSGKYIDYGQTKRIDFIRFLETKDDIEIDVYGDNRWGYKNYRGSLPSHCKDDGLFPYKYTFNAENNEIKNYYTEKLIDGILSECLVFYWGCPNIRELLDPKAYVQLTLNNFEIDYHIIKTAIRDNWHSQRLPYIRECKNKILNETQFYPRLEKFLNCLKVED